MDTLKLLIRGRGAVPDRLEPAAGVSQCNYELLRAFDGYMRNARLRWSLGAGTLLGAMRNPPPGLLQWEHDVDADVPARDASALLRRLRRDGCATADGRGAAGAAARSSCGSRPSRSTAAAGRAAAGASSCTTAARRRASSTSSSSR